MSNFQDIVADAEKEAKKKLDEYRIKQEAELQAKQVQADLDKERADRELELRREQYLKDKFSSDPDKYTKAMVANSISTRINIDKLITDFKPSTSTTPNRTTSNEETEPKEDYFKMFAIGIAIVAVAVGISLVLKEKDEKIENLTNENKNSEYRISSLEEQLEKAENKKAQEDIIIVHSAEDAYNYAIEKVAIICGQIIFKHEDTFSLRGKKDTTRQVFVSAKKLLQEKEYIPWFQKVSEVGTSVCVIGTVSMNIIYDNPYISVHSPLQVILLR